MTKHDRFTCALWAVFLVPIPLGGLIAFFSQPWRVIWPTLLIASWLGIGTWAMVRCTYR